MGIGGPRTVSGGECLSGGLIGPRKQYATARGCFKGYLLITHAHARDYSTEIIRRLSLGVLKTVFHNSFTIELLHF